MNLQDLLTTRLCYEKQKNGQVDTLIPLLYQEYGNAQTAADVALALVKTAVSSFEETARSLLQTVAGDAALTRDVIRFIEGCRYACTGNLDWRYVT